MPDVWIQRYSDTVTDTAELQNTEFIELPSFDPDMLQHVSPI